ncbi:MAG TPA: sulfite exporter TauE/SafE family protein [bacterium]|nr:sulfite exporter TauE/SafE family protein [bacterium]
MDTSLLIAVTLTVFLSTMIRSTFGFGDALVAMPLLTMFLGLKSATPLVALLASTIAFVILIRRWREVDMAGAWRLMLSTAFGIPLGLLLLKSGWEVPMKMLLAAVIIGFVLHQWLRPQFRQVSGKAAWIFGFIAGILGGAYNTNGPPVVVFGTLRCWDPARFRATLQGYFFPTGLLILASHGMGGLWTREIYHLYLLCLPVVLTAVLAGGYLHARIPSARFMHAVYGFLMLLGLSLFIQTLGFFD